MLYTLEQLKRSFINMMVAGFAPLDAPTQGTDLPSHDNDLSKKIDGVLENAALQKELQDYFHDLDNNDSGNIDEGDNLSSKQQELYKKVMKQLGYEEGAIDNSPYLHLIFERITQIAATHEGIKTIENIQKQLLELKESKDSDKTPDDELKKLHTDLAESKKVETDIVDKVDNRKQIDAENAVNAAIKGASKEIPGDTDRIEDLINKKSEGKSQKTAEKKHHFARYEDVNVQQEQASEKTKEGNTKINSTFSSPMSRAEYLNKNQDIKAELTKYMSTKTAAEIDATIDGMFNVLLDPKTQELEATYYGLNMGNADNALKVLQGYNSQNTFRKDKEAMVIYETLNATAVLQEQLLSNPTSRDTINYFLDKDGSTELQGNELSYSFLVNDSLALSENDGALFKKLVENATGEKFEDFMNSPENLYAKRNKLTNAINLFLAGPDGAEFIHLLKSEKEMKAGLQAKVENFKSYSEELRQGLQVVATDKVNEVVATETQYSEADKKSLVDRILSQINIDGVLLSLINGNPSLSKSVILGNITDAFSSSITFTASEQGIVPTFGVGLFTKQLAELGMNLGVGINLLNGDTGLAGGMTVIDRSNEISLGSGDESHTNVRAFGSIGIGNIVSGLGGISRSNTKGLEFTALEGSSEAIRQELEAFKPFAEFIVTQIMSGEKVEEKQVQELFEGFGRSYGAEEKAQFENFRSNVLPGLSQQARFLKQLSKNLQENAKQTLLHTLLEDTNNKLMQANNGTNLAALKVGVMQIPGFLNFPIIGAKIEEITSIYKAMFTNVEAQEETTETVLSGEKLKEEGIIYDDTTFGMKTFSIPTTYSVQTKIKTDGMNHISLDSDLREKAQIQEKDGRLYIGGVSAKDISVVEYADNGVLTRYIEIGNGERKDGKLVASSYEYKDITKPLAASSSKTRTLNEAFDAGNFATENPIAKTLQSMNAEFSHESLRKVKGLEELQKSIHDMTEATIDAVWDKYVQLAETKAFKSILGTEAEEFISFLPLITEQKDKVAILQSLKLSLSSRAKLPTDKEGFIVLGEKYKNIRDYETKNKREVFFNNLMNEQLPSFSAAVQDARKQWLEKFGDAKKLPTTLLQGKVGLSGTQIGKENTKENRYLSPVVSNFSIVGNGTEGMFKIDTTDEMKADYINKLPDYVINKYIAGLQEKGFKDITNTAELIAAVQGKSPRVEMTTAFARNAECMNDCIVVDFSAKENTTTEEKYETKAKTAAGKDVQENKVTPINLLFGAGKKEEIKPDPAKTVPGETPENPNGEPGNPNGEPENPNGEPENPNRTTKPPVGKTIDGHDVNAETNLSTKNAQESVGQLGHGVEPGNNTVITVENTTPTTPVEAPKTSAPLTDNQKASMGPSGGSGLGNGRFNN